jgi:hypothetical protein
MAGKKNWKDRREACRMYHSSTLSVDQAVSQCTRATRYFISCRRSALFIGVVDRKGVSYEYSILLQLNVVSRGFCHFFISNYGVKSSKGKSFFLRKILNSSSHCHSTDVHFFNCGVHIKCVLNNQILIKGVLNNHILIKCVLNNQIFIKCVLNNQILIFPCFIGTAKWLG